MTILRAMQMNSIDTLFARLREQGRKAFLAFLTAGDPDIPSFVAAAREVVAAGADVVEVGFPYSDPIADGPVIQASYNRALERGLQLDQVFSAVRQLADSTEVTARGTPLVAMVSFSIVYRHNLAAFLDRALEAGLSGAIVPDLPLEESDELCRLAAERDFKLILLTTPTTPRDRALQIARRSTGFLYCVSVTGITGERDRLSVAIRDQLAWLREQTKLPLCVGFGISKPEHVALLRELADGIIVGSALVRKLEDTQRAPADVRADLRKLVQELTCALNDKGA